VSGFFFCARREWRVTGSSYKPEYCAQAEKLCKLGATNPELGDFFEVTRETINQWMQKHSDFKAAIKLGKMEADAKRRIEALPPRDRLQALGLQDVQGQG
jgi:hypothetical protein